MKVRRCDCCHRDIEPFTGKLFSFKKYYIRVDVDDAPGRYRHYDLCDRCAKFIEDTIKVGAKPEWLESEGRQHDTK